MFCKKKDFRRVIGNGRWVQTNWTSDISRRFCTFIKVTHFIISSSVSRSTGTWSSHSLFLWHLAAALGLHFCKESTKSLPSEIKHHSRFRSFFFFFVKTFVVSELFSSFPSFYRNFSHPRSTYSLSFSKHLRFPWAFWAFSKLFFLLFFKASRAFVKFKEQFSPEILSFPCFQSFSKLCESCSKPFDITKLCCEWFSIRFSSPFISNFFLFDRSNFYSPYSLPIYLFDGARISINLPPPLAFLVGC